MINLAQRAEWLFAAPWRLLALVAIFVALPILALSELSANDARERIRAAELDALAIAARRAAASLDDRVQTIAGDPAEVAGVAGPLVGVAPVRLPRLARHRRAACTAAEDPREDVAGRLARAATAERRG